MCTCELLRGDGAARACRCVASAATSASTQPLLPPPAPQYPSTLHHDSIAARNVDTTSAPAGLTAPAAATSCSFERHYGPCEAHLTQGSAGPDLARCRVTAAEPQTVCAARCSAHTTCTTWARGGAGTDAHPSASGRRVAAAASPQGWPWALPRVDAAPGPGTLRFTRHEPEAHVRATAHATALSGSLGDDAGALEQDAREVRELLAQMHAVERSWGAAAGRPEAQAPEGLRCVRPVYVVRR